jgi:hypothetical protein
MRRRLFAKVAAILVMVLGVSCGSSETDIHSEVPEVPAVPEPLPEPAPEPESPACEAEFESTFAAIQTTIFENQGCNQGACHGASAAGDLRLTADVSYEQLLAPSLGSALARVAPLKVNESYLFRKLSAATAPELLTGTIAGAPMPIASPPIPGDHLEALRLWIEIGAPETGIVGDEFGGTRIADLLGTCLPPPSPIVLEPLPPPDPTEGVQMVLPVQSIAAGQEVEVCFAEYYDFRDQIPAEYQTEDGNFFYVNGEEYLSEANTHHLTLSFSGFRGDRVGAPEFGTWRCAGGARHQEVCDPLTPKDCGEGQCHSEIGDNVACIGYGPSGGADGATPGSRLQVGNGREGYFAKVPSHGIFYWNSHFFNLSSQPLDHHSWHNLSFTGDLRFEEIGFQDTSAIWVAAGTEPFTKKEYCREYVLPRGTRLLSLFSHTHKRGERFTMHLKGTGEQVYDNPFWDDPVIEEFDPARLFDSEDPADRTLVYCALYNNGVRRDGTPDVDMVKRYSRRPPRSECIPTHCAEGQVGLPCDGGEDHATCDSSPGSDDGFCDACPISAGLTSDDEMFVALGTMVLERREDLRPDLP